MDMELNEEQTMLVDAVRSLGERWQNMPNGHERDSSHFAADLEAELRGGGFLSAGLDVGMLEAALVVLETSRLPVVTSAGASALVAPALLGEMADGAVAIVSRDPAKPQRLLGEARYALIDLGDDVALLDMAGVETEAVPSIYAYPYAKFAGPLDLSGAKRLGAAARATLVQWQRVAIAAECAGAAQSAIDITVDHVKQRIVFGRAIGTFQAVQHRLAQCYQIARGIRFLALHAAWSGDALAADLAATYAQDHVNKLAFDLHQFNGGMGVTNEHKLHFWTYRLRALQAEAAGADGAATAIYERLWGEAA